MNPRRNVVVILCDQLRTDFLPAYGCDAIATPNLDRLAAHGVVFDRAITSSTVCAPARAGMMTGRLVSDHGVWTNDVPFREGLEYIAPLMRACGYRTGAFGKMHHYPARDSKGFDTFVPMEEGRLGRDEPYLQWLRQRHPEVESLWQCEHRVFRFAEDDYYEHWIADRAMEFMDAEPFLAWISFQGPHPPFDPPREVHGTCRPERLPAVLRREATDSIPETVRIRTVCGGMSEVQDPTELRTAYAEMIVAIDRQVGRILDHLSERGLLDNTTVIFSADHGDMLGDYGLNGKGPFPYRAQLNVPLVVSNHPRIEKGTHSHALANNLDIPGTLLDIAGGERRIGVSRSLLDLAQPQPVHPRAVNFSEFCDSIKTVENTHYRLAYYPFSSECELHDLGADPNETTNLAEEPHLASIREALLRHIVDYLILAKGPRIETHDCGPDQQRALLAKDPAALQRLPIAFPLNRTERERLLAAGLDGEMNRFAHGRDVLRYYAPPYWWEDRR